MTATTKQNETKSLVYSTRIDIPVEMRSQVNILLNQSLATAIDLKTQIKYAHWNVKGKDFYQLHLLFDEIASEVEEFIDLIAERIATLGGKHWEPPGLLPKNRNCLSIPSMLLMAQSMSLHLAIAWQFTPNPSVKTLKKQIIWVTWIPTISLLRFHER